MELSRDQGVGGGDVGGILWKEGVRHVLHLGTNWVGREVKGQHRGLRRGDILATGAQKGDTKKKENKKTGKKKNKKKKNETKKNRKNKKKNHLKKTCVTGGRSLPHTQCPEVGAGRLLPSVSKLDRLGTNYP